MISRYSLGMRELERDRRRRARAPRVVWPPRLRLSPEELDMLIARFTRRAMLEMRIVRPSAVAVITGITS